LPLFKISCPVALGIDESVVPWELMTKKKCREESLRGPLLWKACFFSFLKNK
jgi:hypothetical protein